MGNKSTIIIIIAIILGVILGIVLISPSSSEKSKEILSGINEIKFGNEEAEKYSLEKEQNPGQVYNHQSPNFSFPYPEGFKVSSFIQSGQEMVLVQNNKKAHAFQIALSFFDEPNNSLNADRIRRDIVDLNMEDPKQINIGEKGSGVSFVDKDTGMREVWFVYNNFLYQITATRESEGLLEAVLENWSF